MPKLNKKNLLIIFFLGAIFFIAVIVWYSPVIFKGYPIQTVGKEMILARNYHLAGVLADQNDLNVTIASSLVKNEGHPLVLSEYLGSFFYAKIFNFFGVPNYNDLILLSIILYALVLVLFAVLILYLFGFKVAIVFSLIYIFSPIGWGLAYALAEYEFCLIFLALFFIFYFVGLKKDEKNESKVNNIFFVVSGIFLALSALSSEAILVFVLAFFIFLFFKKHRKQLIYVFVPFIVLMMVFWLPSVLSGENRYISLFTQKAPEKSLFSVYTHVFPDSYTYHFEKEEFLKTFESQNLGWSENLETKKVLTNFGFEGIGLFGRIKVGFYILSQHISRFFSLEDFGGPIFTLLLILGLFYFKNKNKFIYQLSLYWLIISFFVFAFITLVSRNHLMDFIWLIILLITAGLFYLLQIVKDHFRLSEKKSLIFDLLIIVLILCHLVLVNHIVLGRQYDKDFVPRSMVYAQEVKKIEIQDKDVIAVPGDFPEQASTLNYLTDKSFVVFQTSTLEKLFKEEKIKKAFEAFGVKYIIGYPDDLSKRLADGAGVINIASDSLEINKESFSQNKSFLMNLIR